MKLARLLLASVVALVSVSAQAHAQTGYPSGPVTFIVPFSAGGSSDNIVRLLAKHMTEDLGQPVVVQNITGATGTIGASKVARSKADGHELVLLGGTTSLYTTLNPQIGLDFQRDFAPVAAVAQTPFLLVANNDLPVASVKD